MENGLVVRTQVRNILQGTSVKNMSSDFVEMLDQKVRGSILMACQRATQNGRKTVMAKDV